MQTLPQMILNNTLNEPVWAFLDIDKKAEVYIKPYSSNNTNTHEGLADLMNIGLPDSAKWVVNGKGIIVKPSSGEIIAIEFGLYERAFKIHFPHQHHHRYLPIKNRLLLHFKWRHAAKVSLRYFINMFGDSNTEIDITALGHPWVLGIYFTDCMENKIVDYYHYIEDFI
jgi:hypothetical protein